MKMKMAILSVVLLLMGGNLYAANGDLIVNGNLSVGTGVTFSNGTKQTVAGPQLIWDYTVTTPTTSVTSPTLDGNADGGYEFEFIVYNNSGNSNVYYNCYFNNDQAGSHYWTQGIYSSNNAVHNTYIENVGRISSFVSLDNGTELHSVGAIVISPRGFVSAQHHVYRIDNYVDIVSQRKIEAVTNLTRIDIVSSVPNGIGPNSRIRLWKRK
jgi:hypothetical protein